MNKKRMQIYLEDHLALIVGELQLIERCQESNRQSELGVFLERLKSDVQDQKATVEKILALLGFESTIQSRVKQGAAWFAEKIGRLKLNDSLVEYSPLSRVVELEALAAAALERIAMWESIASGVTGDPRLEEIDLISSRQVSEHHLSDLKDHCRSASVEAFATDENKT